MDKPHAYIPIELEPTASFIPVERPYTNGQKILMPLYQGLVPCYNKEVNEYQKVRVYVPADKVVYLDDETIARRYSAALE